MVERSDDGYILSGQWLPGEFKGLSWQKGATNAVDGYAQSDRAGDSSRISQVFATEFPDTAAAGQEKGEGESAAKGGMGKNHKFPLSPTGGAQNLERQASTSSGPKFSGTKLFNEAM